MSYVPTAAAVVMATMVSVLVTVSVVKQHYDTKLIVFKRNMAQQVGPVSLALSLSLSLALSLSRSLARCGCRGGGGTMCHPATVAIPGTTLLQRWAPTPALPPRSAAGPGSACDRGNAVHHSPSIPQGRTCT